MKIESQKTNKIPKYAAALAALVSAAALTGCAAKEPEIAGDMAVVTDTAETESVPQQTDAP